MGGTVGRWLAALGAVVAAVGFTLVGMATSYIQTIESMLTFGLVLTVGGIVALAVGLVMNAAANRPDRTPH